jgi:ribonuclease R
MPDLSDRIVEYVGKRSYQPLKAKALARRLGVGQPEYRAFRQALRDLVKLGRVTFGKNHVIRPAMPHGTVTGTFRRAAAGFGFVRPHATEPGPGEDIYIPLAAVGDAANGDEVLVRIVRKSRHPGQGPQGEVLRVLERATHQFVGTYVEREGEGLVLVDGSPFAEPIYVGDPGAKGARPDDKVVFEMIRFPSPAFRGEGVITEVLGPRGQPGVDTLSVIRAFELPDVFPDDVLDEARRQAEAFDETDLSGREDFTQDLVITIDPVDARDFDDAVGLAYDSHRRHWTLTVHIADVAHFAPPGSRLDREARHRGTSVYLPQKVLPMFPEIVSNGLASLQQGKVRFVKTAVMEFTATGQRVHARFANGAIKVRRRFTYEQVSEFFRDADAGGAPTGGTPGGEGRKKPPKARAAARELPAVVEPEIATLLLRMREFALVLRQRRFKRGALELNLPETELDLDAEGRVTGAHLVSHDISHQIIEEFMLAANEAVAEHLSMTGVPFLRRVHPAPDVRKLKDYLEFVGTLGYEVNTKRPADRFQLQKVLDESLKRPETYAVHYALLRSIKQAEYSPREEGHYALASENYCHFTSPIRRYPDLTVHRLLERSLRRGKVAADEAELVALGEHCSFTERRAEKAERELIKVKLLEFLRERIGLELEVIITGVEEFGFFGQAETLPIDGLVHVSTLSDDYYFYDGATHSLIGRRTKRRFRLGDKVKVRVARVDTERRQLDFRLAEERPAAKGPAKGAAAADAADGHPRRKRPAAEANGHPRRRRRS